MENKKDRIYKIIMLVFITIMITFMITSVGMYNYFIKTDKGNIESLIKYINISEESETLPQKFEIVKKYLEKYYIGEIDTDKMNEIAIKGYVAGLEDEYTEYLTKEEYEELLISVTGDYVGIGIYMYKDENGNLAVLSPIVGSPAEKAGLQPNDIIVSIDGENAKEMDLEEASSKIKGVEGTTVELEVARGNETTTKVIERQKVVIADSTSKVLDGNIGYIQLTVFDENSTKNVTNYLTEFKNKGITSVILDLRDNTGGIVSEAINLSELFIKNGDTIMRSYNKTEEETVVKSKNNEPLEIKLVVLVNEHSASATEIVTAALQDNKVATIVGTKTYGKGVMQEVMPLFDGAIKITIEEFKTPNGNKINKQGITPDVIIEEDLTTVDDEQLQKAIEVIKGE